MLLLMGLASALQKSVSEKKVHALVFDAAIGWSGAMWVCDRLNCFYSVAAAVTVAAGINDTWEWPPLMGSFKDGWSVRRIWRYVAPQIDSQSG